MAILNDRPHRLYGMQRTSIEIAEILKSPSEIGALQLMLIPGESIWQVADRVERSGFGEASELLELAADHGFAAKELRLPVGRPRPARPDGIASTYLEGFLMPGTYDIAPSAQLRGVVRLATSRFENGSWAENTVPMLPLARRSTSSYLPIFSASIVSLTCRLMITAASMPTWRQLRVSTRMKTSISSPWAVARKWPK